MKVGKKFFKTLRAIVRWVNDLDDRLQKLEEYVGCLSSRLRALENVPPTPEQPDTVTQERK